MAPPSNIPTVQLIGEVTHPQFRDAIELLRCESRLTEGGELPPELIVVALSRPDAICSDQLNLLRGVAPLAGIVALLGSWCEGETRTGRPWPGAQRLYWYEFPAWWARQMFLRAAGRCPDWARPANCGLRIADYRLPTGGPGRPGLRAGLVIVQSSHRESAAALADVFKSAGYAIAWQRPGRPRPVIRGAIAGIWDGDQLSEREATDIAEYCTQLGYDGAPVLALLDFPRRDRIDRALEVGAAAVLGKPALNSDLVTTLDAMVTVRQHVRAA
jgi:hypothetical protein